MQDDNNIWNHKELYISDLDKYLPSYTHIIVYTLDLNIVFDGELIKAYPLIRKSRINFMTIGNNILSITI